MKRFLVVLAAALTLFGCASLRHKNQNPYEHRLFIEQFLDRRNPLDAQILDTIAALRLNPRSAPLTELFANVNARLRFSRLMRRLRDR